MDYVIDSGFAVYLRKVYGTVAAGILVSAAMVFLLATSPDLSHMFYHMSANGKHAVQFTMAGWIALFMPLVLMFVLGAAVAAPATPAVLNGLYGIFCASFGVSLYAITSQYTGASVGSALLITAGSFIGLSATGVLIKRPLTGLASFCTMGLWGLVIVGFAQLIFHFTLNQTIVSLISIVIFAGLTVTDSQEMRDRYSTDGNTPSGVLMGAIGLYLDAMNLFINILNIVGVKSDD